MREQTIVSRGRIIDYMYAYIKYYFKNTMKMCMTKGEQRKKESSSGTQIKTYKMKNMFNVG